MILIAGCEVGLFFQKKSTLMELFENVPKQGGLFLIV